MFTSDLSGAQKQLPAQPLVAIITAHVQEDELQHVRRLADETVLQHGDADQLPVIEQTVAPAAVVVTLARKVRRVFPVAGRPALHVEVVRAQRQCAIDEAIGVVDHLAAVDRPDQRKLVTLQRSANDHPINHCLLLKSVPDSVHARFDLLTIPHPALL